MPQGVEQHQMTVPSSRIDVQSDDEHEAWPEIDLAADEEKSHGTSPRLEEPSDRDDGGRYTGDKHDARVHEGKQLRCSSEEAAPIASTSSSYNSSEDEEFQSFSGDVFVRHRVHHKDTMASLAVRYNVSISDIKRANGYQNDSALYGKEWVIIPKKPLPIDPEHAAWAGMILAHYEGGLGGIDGIGHAQGELGDGRASSSMHGLKQVSPRGMRRLAGLDEEERALLRASERRNGGMSEGREVEMIQTTLGASSSARENGLSMSKGGGVAPRGVDDASQELYDPVTREFFDSLREKDAAKSTPQLFSPETAAKIHAWKERSSTLAMKELKNIQGRSIRWRDTLVNKLKRIGSQPTMGSTAGSSLGLGSGHARASSLGDGSGNDGGGLKKD